MTMIMTVTRYAMYACPWMMDGLLILLFAVFIVS